MFFPTPGHTNACVTHQTRVASTSPLAGTPKSSRVGQIPRLGGSAVQILRIERRAASPVVSRFRVDDGKIAVEYASPAASDLVNSTIAEVGRPLLTDEILIACIRRRRIDGDHVNTLDEFGISSEVSRMVDLVLKEDPCDFVCYEIGGLIGVAGFQEEIILERAFLDRQH